VTRPGIGARLRLAALGTTIALAAHVAAADSTAESEARRLADESRRAYHRAEAAETGWAEIYDQGIDLARRSIALDPSNAEAHYSLFLNLGRKSQRTGVTAQFRNISELKAELAKTLDLDPNHANAWEAQGEMLLQLPRLLGGSRSEGENALRRSQELAPSWAKPPLRLAELYEKDGNMAEARTEASRALELARKSGDTRLASDAEAILNRLSPTAR
jgi:tetratricopeptide (TPR) repeat protein